MDTPTPAPVVPVAKPAPVDLLLLEEIGPREPSPTKMVPAVAHDEVGTAMENIRKALVKNIEDEDQTQLVDAIQEHRTLLLKYVTQQYLSNPKSASLLIGLISLINDMEKTVRDDRKEKMKKQDSQNNIVAFNQMVDAMKSISAGKIDLPVFDMQAFILDPSKSLITPTMEGINPITAEELVQGNSIVDIDGKTV